MFQGLRAVPGQISRVGQASCRIEVIREQVHELDSTLEESSPKFQAALLLLGSIVVGQNTYRLSSITGLDSRFVAQCARRLIDNGVWSGGVTWSAWFDEEDGTAVFWADVEVALGRVCRRIDDNGVLCWALAGEWWKPFELTSSPAAGIEIDYRVPSWQGASGVTSSAEDDRGDGIAEEAPSEEEFYHAAFPASGPVEAKVSALSPVPEFDCRSAWKDVTSSAFPGVVWLT